MGNRLGPRRDHTGFAHAFDTVAIAGVLTIALGSSVVRWFTTLNHDAAYFLAQAKMVSQGRNLYDDLIDKDTPVNTLVAQVSIAFSSMRPAARPDAPGLVTRESLPVGVSAPARPAG